MKPLLRSTAFILLNGVLAGTYRFELKVTDKKVQYQDKIVIMKF
jgi:hypothetical protein